MALQSLATYHRKKLNLTIIGITGSCGKTSLKELLGNSLKKISNVISFGNLFPAILTEKFVAKCFRAKITIKKKEKFYYTQKKMVK